MLDHPIRAYMLALTLIAATPLASAAPAAEYPVRPITLVAPFAAGSVTDAVARVVGSGLSKNLGQTVVIENRAGAQGTIGAAHVANAQPDGYTLLVSSSVMYVANRLIKTLPYDPVKSFEPVAAFGATAMMVVVPATSPLNTLADLDRALKQNQPPITIAYGSPSGQVAVALLNTLTGARPTSVGYRSIPQAMTDLLGGHVNVAVVDVGTGLSHVGSGKARALGISSDQRYVGAPDIPTFRESYPGASGALETIIGIQAPAGTPPAVIAKLDNALAAVMRDEAVKTQFSALNTSVLVLNARAFAQRVESDNPKWEALMEKAGITPQ